MQELKSSNNKQLKQISSAHLLEEGGHSRFVRQSIIVVAGILFVFLFWSIVTDIDEVAMSFGEVQPVQDVQVVQHLEGGIISSVYVKNSQEVQVGETLLKLNPEPNFAELQKSESKQMSLNLDLARLHAFINHTPADQVNWMERIKNSQYNTPMNQKKIMELIKEGENLLRQQNNDRDNQRKILKEKILQSKVKLQQSLSAQSSTEKQLALFVKEESMYATLSPKGYVSEKDYLNAQRKTLEARGELKKFSEEIKKSDSEIHEAQNELAKLDSTLNKAALQEVNQINTQLLETQHTIQRLTEANSRLTITAPIAGIVKGLTALPGTVLSPGAGVLEIVPTQGDMQVECRISPHDVGHVSVGDPADVKVASYEFARYGSVAGKVIEISASTFITKDKEGQGQPFYKAKVSLSQNYVGHNPKLNQLKPGMTVQVDIITGKKSVMSYLLKPITRAVDTAFRER